MKNLFKVLFVLFIFINYSCENEADNCFTPPSGFAFELVDKTTGENLFTNGTYNSKDIVVKNLDNPTEKIKYSFISENNNNVISFRDIGWNTEIINYSFSISTKTIFEFRVDAERINKGCSHTEYKNFEIKNASYELDKTKGVYKILVNTEI